MAVESLLGTKAQRAFMITIAIQAIVVIALVSSTFGIVHGYLGSRFDEAGYKTLPCYLALFILAEIFELALAFDALRLRNIIQLLSIIVFHGALIVFSALQVRETNTAIGDCTLSGLLECVDDADFLWDKVKPFLVIAPCIISASWFLLMFWIKRLYEEFGWEIFHVVGANPKLKSMYQYYQIFICFLKIDFFCFVGVTMQLLIVVLSTDSTEFGLTIAAIPIVLILLAGCAFAVQREVKWLMAASLTLMVAAMTYLYKLFRFYEPSSEAQYLSTRATLTVFTIVAFILLLASFMVGVKCLYDFDKGLHDSKTQGINTDVASPKLPERQTSYYGIPLQPQISIE